MRISDWSSDVCSSDLTVPACPSFGGFRQFRLGPGQDRLAGGQRLVQAAPGREIGRALQRLVARLGAFRQDRKGVVKGKGVSVRVGLSGTSILKQKNALSISYNRMIQLRRE